MEIVINRNAQQQTALIKTIQKQFYYKQFAIAFGLFIIALLLMFMKLDVMNKTLPFWNPFSAFAMGIVMIAALRMQGLYKQYKQASKLKSENVHITISNEAITYRAETHELKFLWPYFKFYRLNGTLIIIAKDITNKNTLVIDRNEINEDEFKFLQSLLFDKKILKRK
ncbi:hypothetical protein ACTJKC_22650 [Pedobacter sp. 22226]|uniref:hypothetical protein n=1 Tax=Pedobacter sp. 22226 TaxID=3453894 RepID=UPI003F8347B8